MGWRLAAIALVISVVSTAEAQRTKSYELRVSIAPRVAIQVDDALSRRVARCLGRAHREFEVRYRIEISGRRARAVSSVMSRGRPQALPCIRRAIRAHNFGEARGMRTITISNQQARTRRRGSCMMRRPHG